MLYSYITKDILVQKWKMIDIIVGVFASSNVCIYIYIYIYIIYSTSMYKFVVFSLLYIMRHFGTKMTFKNFHELEAPRAPL